VRVRPVVSYDDQNVSRRNVIRRNHDVKITFAYLDERPPSSRHPPARRTGGGNKHRQGDDRKPPQPQCNGLPKISGAQRLARPTTLRIRKAWRHGWAESARRCWRTRSAERTAKPVMTVASIATAKWPVSTPSANPRARDERLAHHRAPEAGRANVMPHRVGCQTRCGPR